MPDAVLTLDAVLTPDAVLALDDLLHSATGKQHQACCLSVIAIACSPARRCDHKFVTRPPEVF